MSAQFAFVCVCFKQETLNTGQKDYLMGMLSFVEYTCTYKKKWKHLLINADTGSASLTTSDH